MFIQKLNLVTTQVENEYQDKRKTVRLCLYSAIKLWCYQFHIDQNITNYILDVYRLPDIQELTNYIYQQWEPKEEEERNLWGQVKSNYRKTKLFNLVEIILNQVNIRSENMKIVVLIAFAFTAVSFWIYQFNQQGKQQQTRREEPIQTTPNAPYSPPKIPKIAKQFLVLVISASQTDFLKLIKDKRHIDLSESEGLYEVTKYLWLGSETEFFQKTANINQYLVSKGEETEYDIYLVYVELKQSNEGFKPNVNQLDRYDAFRELVNLAVSFQVSPRLKMEAYENIEVYSR